MPPPNPAFVTQPQYPGYPQPGFPTASNAPSVVEGPAPLDITELTSEEAVRSGKYSGKMRQQILTQLQNGGGNVNVTNAPRVLQPPVQYTQVPGGAMQPIGNPTGPVLNPQMVQPQYQYPQQGQPPQQVVYAQPPQQQYAPQPQQFAPPPVAPPPPAAFPPGPAVNSLREQAAAAIQRTHAGANPVATPEVTAAFQQANQFARANGGDGSPQNAVGLYNSRFAATPPEGN